MFQFVKEQVPLLKGIAHYTGKEFQPAGTNTLELEDRTCPFPACGHKDCFRIKTDGDTGEGILFRCFSCGETGSDTVAFVSSLFGIKKPKEAAEKVAADFKFDLPTLPNGIHQDIFEVTARFYHHCLLTSTDHLVHEDRGYTPLQYQVDVRKHSRELLEQECVGWSGRGYVEYMDSLGYSEEDLVASGLVKLDPKGQPREYFGVGAFIYPHYVAGKVSHFTQKTPDKIKLAKYQLRNEHRLNGYEVYGQDEAASHQKIFIVEGENDRLSLKEFIKGRAGVVAIIGQISKRQCDWIRARLKDKENIYTVFDNDDAGEKYRSLVASLGLPNLTQYKVPDPYNDIDQYITDDPAPSLDKLILVDSKVDTGSAPIADGANVKVARGGAVGSVFEQGNCYYRMQTNKKGQAEPVKLSNFCMRLKNVFVKMGDGSREREVVVIREDGKEGTSSVIVTSDVKTRLVEFKIAMADAADVTFYGSEADLQGVWDWVYNQGTERTILMSPDVGHQEESQGWLFRDCFIHPDGSLTYADKDGLISLGDVLITPQSNVLQSTGNKRKASRDGIPRICTSTPRSEEGEVKFRNEFYRQFLANIGDVGVAVTMLAWMKACAYSDYLFERYHFFPFLYIWGKHAQGKSAVAAWLLQTYGMAGIGEMSLSRLGSGVGFNRMMATYASLPILLDEMRADKLAADLHGPIRSWYNRVPKVMGTRDDASSVVSQPVKSCIMFCGQDILTDVAARSRCIEVEIPSAEVRDMVHSYQWIEQHRDELPALGREWIREALSADMNQIAEDVRSIEQMLIARTRGDSRVCRQWAVIGMFADHILTDLGMDEYNLEAYLVGSCQGRVAEQEEDSLITRFFTMVEGIQIQPNSPITTEHIRVDSSGQVFIWLADLYRIVSREREMSSNATTFSAKALNAALRAEPWYVGTEPRSMGMNDATRRVVILKGATYLPQVLQSIVATATSM
jgi:5S rRNA maturation endonuclease (ribonuclease M5)